MPDSTTRRHVAVVLMAALLGLTPPTAPADAAGCGPGEEGHATAHGIVAKLRRGKGTTIRDVTKRFPVTVQSPSLASRGIYLVTPTDPAVAADVRRTAKLAEQIDGAAAVEYAEPNYTADLADHRYPGRPDGDPRDAGTDAYAWLEQPVALNMHLSEVHRSATGAGTVVAVLDTGVERSHPALGDRLVAGHDYVADDPDPAEERMGHDCNGNRVVDEAYGHGTFVAGMVRLVAPDARIMPMRVLESDGTGTVFAVAEAITDALSEGADVINLSLATSARKESRVVSDLLDQARRQGVVAVAAAGNSASDTRQHPAQDKSVVSVTSLDTRRDDVSEFAAWGDWVDLASPADDVVGPFPDGGYAIWAGTTMAAAQVSGQIALIRSRRPELSTDKVIGAVQESARKVKGLKKLKYGAVDIDESLRRAGRR